jgi:hypothetical protein
LGARNTDGLGVTETVTSAATAPVRGVNTPPSFSAFAAAVAKDNGGLTSSSAVPVQIAVTPVNDPVTGKVEITGTAAQGQTLTAVDHLEDVDGKGPVSYTWQTGATLLGIADSYTPTASDVGHTITVTASFTDLQGSQESKTSAPTAPVV